MYIIKAKPDIYKQPHLFKLINLEPKEIKYNWYYIYDITYYKKKKYLNTINLYRITDNLFINFLGYKGTLDPKINIIDRRINNYFFILDIYYLFLFFFCPFFFVLLSLIIGFTHLSLTFI